MAVPVDAIMTARSYIHADAYTDEPAGAQPRPAPLAMPTQMLGERGPQRARSGPRSHYWRKAIVGFAAVALTIWAVREMYEVVSVAETTPLEWALLALFAVNFAWIGFAFATATAGFCVLVVRAFGKRSAAGAEAPIVTRTAVLFPVYNEDPAHVFATVKATAEALDAAAPGRFEAFILSDTNDADAALAEEEAYLALREGLAAHIRVFYRRRTINLARKSGNIEDFVTRWGGRYDHMIVFDADSVMETQTLLELVRRMQADPDAGLIQTVPRLVGARTLFARAQQFAARLYGPVLAAGYAWWAQNEGNFWGHNAIIRIRAFAEAAGLPSLPGSAPFGGAILSHDFVEAALLRRAGWTVQIANDLEGSYEECPPTIIDIGVRDRRWAQGNLQHTKVLLRARGLTWTSRLHLIIGVMSYLASPMWLLLILTGMALSLQAQFLRPEYFPGEFSLFPRWPVIDDARALALFGVTMAILFAPKLYGLAAAAVDAPWRRRIGAVRTTLGVLMESVISILTAPLLMATQTAAVLSILFGRDTGWTPQQREAGGYAPADVLRRHAGHMLFGLALMGAALAISPVFAAWLSPAGVALMLAGPISLWTGGRRAGEAARRMGLMTTPEELDPPASVAASRAARAVFGKLPARAVSELVESPALQLRRLPLIDRRWPLTDGEPHPPAALAAARIALARDLAAALAAMPKAERLALINDPDVMQAAQRRFAGRVSP